MTRGVRSVIGGLVYAALVVYAVVGTGALWNVVVIYAMVAALWSVMIGSGAGYIAVFIVHIVVVLFLFMWLLKIFQVLLN